MGASIREALPQEVKDFRARHGLATQPQLARLLGFATNGKEARNVVRWETEGGPPYIKIMLAYAERHGLDLLKEAADGRKDPAAPAVPGSEVIAFRERHNLTQPALDRLFGSVSAGRSSRAWEAGWAPGYVGLIFAYADKYGLDVMEEIAIERSQRKAA